MISQERILLSLRRRIENAKKILSKLHVDFLCIPTFCEPSYSHPFYYYTDTLCESGMLIIKRSGNPILYVSGFEFEAMSKSKISTLYEVKKYQKQEIPKIKSLFKGKVIGFDGGSVSYALFKHVSSWGGRWKDLNSELQQFWIILDDVEIERMKSSASIATNILYETIEQLPLCKTEEDVRKIMLGLCAKNGVEQCFPVIVASGANASYPHHKTGNGKLKKGFLIIDFGVRYQGYCSDMTRTVFLGKPTDTQVEHYYKVLEAQMRSEQNALPGKTGKEIDASARNLLGGLLVHATGHGLGRFVHQRPSISPRGDEAVQPGVVFTLEPGMYVEDSLGIRIEDDYLMTANGAQRLTGGSRDLIIIDMKT